MPEEKVFVLGGYGSPIPEEVLQSALSQMRRSGEATFTLRNPESREEITLRVPSPRRPSELLADVLSPFPRLCPCCRRPL